MHHYCHLFHQCDILSLYLISSLSSTPVQSKKIQNNFKAKNRGFFFLHFIATRRYCMSCNVSSEYGLKLPGFNLYFSSPRSGIFHCSNHKFKDTSNLRNLLSDNCLLSRTCYYVMIYLAYM